MICFDGSESLWDVEGEVVEFFFDLGERLDAADDPEHVYEHRLPHSL